MSLIIFLLIVVTLRSLFRYTSCEHPSDSDAGYEFLRFLLGTFDDSAALLFAFSEGRS